MKNKFFFGIFLSLLILLELISAQIVIDNTLLNKLNTQNEVRVIIEFDQSLQKDDLRNIKLETLFNLSDSDFIIKNNLEDTNWFSGEITKEGLEKLRRNENIVRIYIPLNGNSTLQQSLPLIDVNPEIWNLGYTGKGQTVCIVDSGVNYSHLDLGNCTEAQFLAGTCSKVLGGYDFANTDSNPMDDYGHGTHVAGIVAANGKINGTAPDAKLVVVKVTNSNGIWSDDELASGIDWCDDYRDVYNIGIITISLGSFSLYDNVLDCENAGVSDIEINQAYNHGIFVDVSSGNNANLTHLTYPSCVSKATSVGAVYDANVGAKYWLSCTDSTTLEDKITCFTNRGNLLDLLAPGSVINSTDIGGSYSQNSGTSMAAPHVAGAAALLLERDPTLTPDNITSILKETGVNIWDPTTQTTYSRINVSAAINSLCTCTDWSIGSCGSGGCGAYEKPYTRTCTPSGCDVESDCNFDNDCAPGGGEDLTVCASGCDYTTIMGAVEGSNYNDRIFITDSRTYDEIVYMDNASTAGWLMCTNGATIDNSDATGIWIEDVEDSAVIECNIVGSGTCIRIENSRALIQGNNLSGCDVGIYLWKDVVDLKVKENNIIRSGTYGVEFYATSWSDATVNAIIEDNLIEESGSKGIYMRYGLDNTVKENNIFESSDSGDYGVHLYSNDHTSFAEIYDNSIYENYNGLYLDGADYTNITNNVFCSSNTNLDIIDESTGPSGDNNRCEKPGVWDDAGTTGCTYYCDNPATATLLFPPNNYISVSDEGNVNLTCEGEDDYQLTNISLYSNISGTWQKNQTQNITGTLNITTFNISNLANGTNFIWNCFAYDNKSRGSFASANWSLSIIIFPDDPHKFYIRNSSNNPVAWLGSGGNIVLKGKCFSGGSCDNPGLDSFIFRNITDENVAFINSTGDLCIESGDCSDESATCDTNPQNAFIVRNSSNNNVIYIDKYGDLCLTGNLYQNSNP